MVECRKFGKSSTCIIQSPQNAQTSTSITLLNMVPSSRKDHGYIFVFFISAAENNMYDINFAGKGGYGLPHSLNGAILT